VPYAFDAELVPLIEALPNNSFDDIPAARASIIDLVQRSAITADLDGLEVDDRAVPGPDGAPDVTVRVYRPVGATAPRPAVLWLHGGGFCVGGIETEHVGAAKTAKSLGVVVVSVEYRLAPEHPFPAAIEDCYAALQWVHAHTAELFVDPARVALVGQSAGGGLAAGLALLARDRGGPSICFQLLSIPELDDRLETESMKTFVDTPLWNRPNAVLSWLHYLGGATEVSPYAAPARATDLRGLPPAYISAMEFDPLRDEGILYALALLRAGVSVELHSFPGTFHGSQLFPVAITRRGTAETSAVLRRALALG
jgi:acetyl esterase